MTPDASTIAERIFDQETQCLDDRLFEPAFRFPAELPNPFGFEQNFRRIPNPAAAASGVRNRGSDSELATDDPNAFVHLEQLRVPQVEHVWIVGWIRALDRTQHAGDAVG